MNIEEIRAYALSKKGTSEDLPFDETTLVLRVGKKIFMIIPLNNPITISLKCNPEKAVVLRETYSTVVPGFHLNKRLWNTVTFDTIKDQLIKEWIDDSYDEVVKKMTRKEREEVTK